MSDCGQCAELERRLAAVEAALNRETREHEESTDLWEAECQRFKREREDALRQRDEARDYAAEIAQGVSHYPRGGAAPNSGIDKEPSK